MNSLEARVDALEARMDAAEPKIDATEQYNADREEQAAYVSAGWRRDHPMEAHKLVKIVTVTPQGNDWLAANGWAVDAAEGLWVVPIKGVQSYRNVGFVSYEVVSNKAGRQTQSFPVNPPDLATDMRIQLAKTIFEG